ncbi:MAG TPA: AAA family ATPase [Candidatus Dormibacteraeota bacterium]
MARILCREVVGRDRELASLDAALDDAGAGRGSVIVVSGPAGVGKSRLLTEVATRARARAMTVLTGRAVPGTVEVPYRPLGEALLAASGRVRDVPAGELTGFEAALGWIVPAWRLSDQTTVPESPLVVAEGLVRALRVAGGATGCVLLVEDIQWADPETMHALEYLADHAAATRVLTVCTMRDDWATGTVGAIARLETRRAVDVMRLPPLTDDQVQEMARVSLETAALDAGIRRMLDTAEGLPFLVEELLATATTSGALVHRDGDWRLGTVPRVVPESFAITVRERLHALSPAGRRLVGAAALLGRSFDWRIASRAVACDDATAHEILEHAVGLQLLAADSGVYTFRHALTRETVLAELLPHERSQLAARCLALIESTHASALDEREHLAAGLAEWAGQPERAAALLLEAAQRSLSRGAVESSMSVLRRALGLTSEAALRAELNAALGAAAAAAGDLVQTRAAVAALLDDLAVIAAPAARQAEAHLLLARCAVTATHFDVAADELRQARAVADETGERALMARVTAVAAQLAAGQGRLSDAQALAGQASADAEATSQPEVICEALEVASRCARTRDLDEAQAIGERALRVAERAGLAYWRMRALYQIGVVEMFRGWETATLVRAQDEALRLGAVATADTLDLEIAAALEAQHRLDEARALCARCIETSALLDLRGVESMAHLFLAIVEGEQGSRRRMEESISRRMAIGGDDTELLGAIWGDARAVASLAAEDRTRARTELEQAMALYARSQESVVPRLGSALLQLLYAVDGSDTDLESVSGITRMNAQGAAYVACAEAALLGRRGEVEAAMAAFGRGEAASMRAPWYRNLMRRLVSEAAITDGWGEPVTWLQEAARYFDEDGSERLASACRSILRRSGVRVTRPRRSGAPLPVGFHNAGITRREAEVLVLIGDGLSNREIGERLFLSERTVEQHVRGLKQKLGVRSRAQLAARFASEVASVP